MSTLRHLSLLIIAAVLLMGTGRDASAQVAVSIGEPPVCPYGYYEVPPYNCAPDGFYGPEWFSGGVFIGAGPWFHGQTISTATSTIISTTERVTTGLCPGAASGRRNIERNFMDRQCIIRMAMRRLVDTDK
jgi:hypothetical protein